VPAAAFLAREKANLAPRGGGRPRVALIADGIEAPHGVTRTVERIRELGVPGFDVEVIGTDSCVDRRLPSVAELEVPSYEGMTLGVPTVPDLIETLADGRYDLVHVTAPGPAGVAALLVSRVAGLPLLGSYHTEFASYAAIRSGSKSLEGVAALALGGFYRTPQRILSPSIAADASLSALGVDPARIGRWERGVDSSRFDPARADRGAFPGELKVLYAGRLASEKGVGLMAESFLRARESDPRLHLLLAGGGPEEGALRRSLGEHATFLSWLGDEDLARAYASADLFIFCSTADTYGQVISEAGASRLPVIAVAEGGPATLVEEGRTGLLCPADPGRITAALLQLAASPVLRNRLGAGGLRAARARSWTRALRQLAVGYDSVISASAPAAGGEEALAA
jgi:glycosyltransferase involved in cell wall biosynthesis